MLPETEKALGLGHEISSYAYVHEIFHIHMRLMNMNYQDQDQKLGRNYQ